MSDFDEYIKNKYPSDYLLMKVRYPNQELSELYSDQFEVWQHQQAKIDELEIELSTTKQVLGNVIDMEVAKVDDLKAQLNNMEACYIEKKKELEDQHKKVDEVLEYLDGESANRWGLWKEKADMLDQGASNAFEEAYWMAKKALRGEHV